MMAEPAEATEPERRRGAKSETAFRTISEVAADLDVPPHVLRFWESKFTQVRPLKRGGRRRYYRPEDIDLLRSIREFLYTDGYTIKGVQKLLREGGIKALTQGRVVGASSEASKKQHSAQRGMKSSKRTDEKSPPGSALVIEAVTATEHGSVATQTPADSPEIQTLHAALDEVLSELEELRESLRKAIA